jgi:hypothetical protein
MAFPPAKPTKCAAADWLHMLRHLIRFDVSRSSPFQLCQQDRGPRHRAPKLLRSIQIRKCGKRRLVRLDGRAEVQQVAAADWVRAHVGLREDRIHGSIDLVGGDCLRLEQVAGCWVFSHAAEIARGGPALPPEQPQRHSAVRSAWGVPMERRVREPHAVLGDPQDKVGAHHQGATEIYPDGPDLGVPAEQVQRRPTHRGSFVGPSVKEINALRVDAGPVRAREPRTGRHAGSEVEEALAPDLRVGGDDCGCG